MFEKDKNKIIEMKIMIILLLSLKKIYVIDSFYNSHKMNE